MRPKVRAFYQKKLQKFALKTSFWKKMMPKCVSNLVKYHSNERAFWALLFDSKFLMVAHIFLELLPIECFFESEHFLWNCPYLEQRLFFFIEMNDTNNKVTIALNPNNIQQIYSEMGKLIFWAMIKKYLQPEEVRK